MSVRAVSGIVTQELLRESHADLLVVGSRGGGGGFGSLLLGSVSTQIVGHVSCPVVVVPS